MLIASGFLIIQTFTVAKPLRDGGATCNVLRDRDTAEFSCGEVTVNPPSMNILDPVFYSHI